MKEEQFKKVSEKVCRDIFDSLCESKEVSVADVMTILGTTIQVMAYSIEEMTEGHIVASTFMGNFADCLSEFAMEEEKKRMRKAKKQENNKLNYDKYK